MKLTQVGTVKCNLFTALLHNDGTRITLVLREQSAFTFNLSRDRKLCRKIFQETESSTDVKIVQQSGDSKVFLASHLISSEDEDDIR